MTEYWTNKIACIVIAITCMSCRSQTNSEIVCTNAKVVPIGTVVQSLDASIWAIYQDYSGDYWFGSNARGLYRYDGDQLIVYTDRDGLVDNSIRKIQGDKQGHIYIETPSGISIYDGQSFETLQPIRSPDNMWALTSTDLWFHCNAQANDIYRYDGEVLYELTLPRMDLKSAFGAVDPDFTFDNLPYSPYAVYGIDKDQDGHLWIGTVLAGAFRYDGESFLWIADKELSRLADGREPGVRSMVADRDGYYWLSNVISKYQIDSTATPPTFKKLPGIDGSLLYQDDFPTYFNSAITDANGDLWLASFGDGVWKYADRTITYYPIQDDVINVLSIYRDRHDGILLGTFDDGVFIRNGDKFDRFEGH